MDERRRATRIATEIPARLFLSGGRRTDVVIDNVGELGVLVHSTDLEVTVREGDRVLLEHPPIVDGKPVGAPVRSTAAVVRVDLEVNGGAVVRHVALYFDGGPAPSFSE